MAEKKKSTSAKKTSKQVMDVSKPGKTAPSASSRPVIVGHRSMVKDPMVSEDKQMPDSDAEEHKIEVKRAGPKVISPLNSSDEATASTPSDGMDTPSEPKESESVSEDVEESPAEAVPETVPDTPAEEDQAESESDEAQPSEDSEDVEAAQDEEVSPDETEAPTDEAAADDTTGDKKTDKKDSKGKGSSVVDAIAGEAAKNKDKKADKKNEELQKRLAEVEKLVDEKKYFVHTSSTTKKERRTRWVVVILAFLLLAGAYAVVDAQVVKNDLWLPYDFFKEKQSVSTAPDANQDQSRDEASGKDSTGDQQTSADPTDADRDLERKNDLKAVQQALEAFYAEKGYYPSFMQLNNAEFRKTNNIALSDEVMKDPEGKFATFTNATPPAKGLYTYQTQPADCDNSTSQCTNYTVTAVLSSPDDPDADSSGNYVVQSVNQ